MAVLTAFYMSRQVFMTFFGRCRFADATPAEIGEAWDTCGLAEADAGEADAAARGGPGRGGHGPGRRVGEAEEALASAWSEVEGASAAAGAVGAAQLEAARPR